LAAAVAARYRDAMAGYATQARLEGALPRLALIGGRRSTPASLLSAPATEPPVIADQIELVGRPIDERIADWLDSIGESWLQLTFFLFDPESWR
jgi:hypothetical protein